MKKEIKKTLSKGSNLAIIGAALASVAATAYFFFGPKGKKHQQYAKSWAIKMKGEIIEKLEQTAVAVSEAAYHEIIDSVAKKYSANKAAAQVEIDALAADLKKHWKVLTGQKKPMKRIAKNGGTRSKKTSK